MHCEQRRSIQHVNRCTCEFTPENLCFCSLLFTLACFEEVVSRVLKNMIGKQTIHYIFNISEWRVDIWEECGDVVACQARSNSAEDFFSGLLYGNRACRDTPRGHSHSSGFFIWSQRNYRWSPSV